MLTQRDFQLPIHDAETDATQDTETYKAVVLFLGLLIYQLEIGPVQTAGHVSAELQHQDELCTRFKKKKKSEEDTGRKAGSFPEV